MSTYPGTLPISLTLCLLGVTAASRANAQEEAAGRVLFEEAVALLNEGQLSEACPKLEESLRQIFNINAQYFLADCWEKQGKTASAWTTFLSVASKACEAGDERQDHLEVEGQRPDESHHGEGHPQRRGRGDVPERLADLS